MADIDQWPTGRLLSTAARLVERAWNQHLDTWGLNHASVPVLFLLMAGPLNQRTLASSSGVTEQTMSRIVTRLERLGYVVRQVDDGDARRRSLTLTPEGRRALLAATSEDVAEEITRDALREAGVEEASFRSGLEAVVSGLQAADREDDSPSGPPSTSPVSHISTRSPHTTTASKASP